VNAVGGILVQLMLLFWVYTTMAGVTLKMEAVRFSETSKHTVYTPKRRPPTGQQLPREPENRHEVVVD